MPGTNRFYSPTKFHSKTEVVKLGIQCIFISYQQKDKEQAEIVADYLLDIGIDVYFDRYDSDLRIQNERNNPTAVTNAICTGINNSSHMLVIVSPNTIQSSWVPFEIGYGYDKTELSVLCLRGFPKGSLPEYIRSVKIIRDIWDLTFRINEFKGASSSTLIENKKHGTDSVAFKNLSNVMDSLVLDPY